MNYWYGDNPNCGRCGHLNGHGRCSMTACIYPVIETTTIVSPEIKPRTNYDKLISKSPEELAEWLHDIYLISHDIGLSNEWWLIWLRQEVNETGGL